MNLKEYRSKHYEEEQRKIFDWWKANGEDAKETARFFGISASYVYKIINRFL